MPRPRKPDPIKHCKICGAKMVRRRLVGGRLEDRSCFIRRVYCDRKCMARGYEGTIKTPNPKNSRRQSTKVRAGSCEECGATTKLHMHHKNEDPVDPSLSNLQTLCASCHHRWHARHGKQTSRYAGPCLICGGPHKARGYCLKHYQRFRKYGDPLTTKRGSKSGANLFREEPDGTYSRL